MSKSPEVEYGGTILLTSTLVNSCRLPQWNPCTYPKLLLTGDHPSAGKWH